MRYSKVKFCAVASVEAGSAIERQAKCTDQKLASLDEPLMGGVSREAEVNRSTWNKHAQIGARWRKRQQAAYLKGCKLRRLAKREQIARISWTRYACLGSSKNAYRVGGVNPTRLSLAPSDSSARVMFISAGHATAWKGLERNLPRGFVRIPAAPHRSLPCASLFCCR